MELLYLLLGILAADGDGPEQGGDSGN